jgi:hypothetical protein
MRHLLAESKGFARILQAKSLVCSSMQTKNPAKKRGFFMLAEKEGFEPSIPETGMPDFESGAFDHSATSPGIVERAL